MEEQETYCEICSKPADPKVTQVTESEGYGTLCGDCFIDACAKRYSVCIQVLIIARATNTLLADLDRELPTRFPSVDYDAHQGDICFTVHPDDIVGFLAYLSAKGYGVAPVIPEEMLEVSK